MELTIDQMRKALNTVEYLQNLDAKLPKNYTFAVELTLQGIYAMKDTYGNDYVLLDDLTKGWASEYLVQPSNIILDHLSDSEVADRLKADQEAFQTVKNDHGLHEMLDRDFKNSMSINRVFLLNDPGDELEFYDVVSTYNVNVYDGDPEFSNPVDSYDDWTKNFWDKNCR